MNDTISEIVKEYARETDNQLKKMFECAGINIFNPDGTIRDEEEVQKEMKSKGVEIRTYNKGFLRGVCDIQLIIKGQVIKYVQTVLKYETNKATIFTRVLK